MSIMIGLPCGGGNISEQTTIGLFNLGKEFVRTNISHSILSLSNSSLISHGRSRIVNFFLNNTDHEYLFFLDSDIGFQKEDVMKLISYKLPIVTGAYPMKTLPTKYCFNPYEPEERRGDLVKIYGNGLGFALIHRKVFVDIAMKYPGLKYIPTDYHTEYPHSPNEIKNSYHYFSEYKRGNTFLSEDKSFFHRANQVGYDIWLDVSIKLNHTGYHIYGEEQ